MQLRAALSFVVTTHNFPHGTAHRLRQQKTHAQTQRVRLAFTRYRHCQSCMVYGIHKGGRLGSYIAHQSCNSIAIV